MNDHALGPLRSNGLDTDIRRNKRQIGHKFISLNLALTRYQGTKCVGVFKARYDMFVTTVIVSLHRQH